MQDKTKFIIGGGISGLIFAFYNNDYKIISKNVGGKLKNKFMKSTILLHDTPETRKFLSDLGLKKNKPIAQIINYYYKGELLESSTPVLNEIMTCKKLTSCMELDDIQHKHNLLDNTTLSYDDCYIPILEVDLNSVIDLLSKEAQCINEKVIKVNKNEIVTTNQRYEYYNLISTIGAPTFWKLNGFERNLKSLPVSFVYSDTPPLKINKKDVNLIYFIDSNIKFSRVNRYEKNKYLYEFSGVITPKEIKKFHSEINIIEYFVDKEGIIFTDLNNIPPEKTRFIGRFATWNHEHKIQDTIRDSLTKFDFVSIWNKQKEFNSHFFNFNVQDVELQQKLSKDFILHIEDEAHEFLHEINWKMQQYQKKRLNREKLIEEWIDIGKFWLGLGNVWGIGLDEFFREFWRKSETVDERYKQQINFLKSKKDATQ